MSIPANKQQHSRDYEAKNLLVLEGLEAVRKRPAMYIGSTDTRGLMHCLWEIIDNAVDEALAGFGDAIEVRLDGDGSVTVHDHARGIPVDTEPRTGLTGVEVVFTKLHAGGKFGNSSYNATGGLHGVGASVVNALSSRLDVQVDRNGAIWEMSFRRGVPGVFDGDGPDAPFTPGSGLRKVGKVAKAKTGTRVRYWPDRQIFLADAELSLTHLHDRARQTSFLVPGLKLTVSDTRDGADRTDEFVHEGGITEFADFLAPDAPERSVANPFGYQWFPIPWIDGSSEAEAAAGLARASADLQAWLDQAIAAEGVPADRVALVGFSQGTMMALEVAPRRREELAGVVGFSGRLLRPEVLEAEAVTRPPVLLLHGDADEVVAPSSMPEAADALSAAGFTVMAQYMSGMGHGIAPEGLRLALYFLREQLGYED